MTPPAGVSNIQLTPSTTTTAEEQSLKRYYKTKIDDAQVQFLSLFCPLFWQC